MDDSSHPDPVLNPHDQDPARYARVARLVSQALRAANQATLEPDDPTPPSGGSSVSGDLMRLPGRVPWLDVVADLAIAAGYLADIPAEPAVELPIPGQLASAWMSEPGRRCLAAIQAAATTLDGLPGPRVHRDVMVRIALTGALRGAQVAELPR